MGDTDSVYDEFLTKVAYAPNVDPARLAEMCERTKQQGALAGKQLGHFQIIEQLGSGGMGVVYHAEDKVLRRPVALKVLSAWLSASERSHWLLDEARNAAAVAHPNIAAIYEVGEADGLDFIAMEFVQGQSLRDRLATTGPLPLAEALRLALQIAHGLGRAHEAGIVHRDLKPDNVMVAPDGLVKLLDFGLAMPLSAAQGASPELASAPALGPIVGTFAYMSPEQARGAKVDARSDVFSFGVLLLEMLKGGRPRPGSARADALALTLPDAGAAGDALRALLARCLEERAESRFPNGAALTDALAGVVARLEASAPRAVPEAGPATRRPPALRIALVAGAVVAAVAIGARFVFRPAPHELREKRLTANPPTLLLEDAAISPDGTVLAYADPLGLFLRRINPEHTEPLPAPDNLHVEGVAWFPKGDALLVSTNEPGKSERHVWRVHLPGGEVQALAKGPFLSARVAPDGVAFVWLDSTTGALRVGPLDEHLARELVKPDAGEALIRPTWSPDSKWVVFLRVSQVTVALETVNVTTGERQTLRQTPRLGTGLTAGAFAWGPRGIFYTVGNLPPAETGFELWLQPMDSNGHAVGAGESLHMWTGYHPDMMSLSADGHRLAHVRWEAQTAIYIGPLADGGRRMGDPQRITQSERDEFPGSFSPDGRSLLYTSNADGTLDVFLKPLGSSPTRKLDLLGNDFKTWATFAPSGDEILFWRHPWPPVEQPQRATLMRARLDGSLPPAPVLTTHPTSSWTWSANAPGRAHFRCVQSGRCVLGEIDGPTITFSDFKPATGRGQALHPPIKSMTIDAHSWDLSPDGERIIMTGGLGQLRLLTLASGELTSVPGPPECILHHLAWNMDGQSVFATGDCAIARATRSSWKMFHIGLDGVSQVIFEKPSTGLHRLVLSPDGKSLAFAQASYDNDVWLLEGL